MCLRLCFLSLVTQQKKNKVGQSVYIEIISDYVSTLIEKKKDTLTATKKTTNKVVSKLKISKNTQNMLSKSLISNNYIELV